MTGIPLRVFLAMAGAALALAVLAAVVLVSSQGPDPVSQDLVFYGGR